jgi:hypothetical protein
LNASEGLKLDVFDFGVIDEGRAIRFGDYEIESDILVYQCSSGVMMFPVEESVSDDSEEFIDDISFSPHEPE